MEQPGNEDLLEPRVSMVSVVRRDQLDTRALPDQPGGQVLMELRAKEVCKGTLARQVSRVLEVAQAQLDLPE